jgi:hypothetical protein
MYWATFWATFFTKLVWSTWGQPDSAAKGARKCNFKFAAKKKEKERKKERKRKLSLFSSKGISDTVPRVCAQQVLGIKFSISPHVEKNSGLFQP